MAVKRVSPEEAWALMEQDGYVYVDVRSVPEFQGGHPKGAYNIPILNMGAAGMAPNPEFLSVFQKTFPKDARLVVGCQTGGRSFQAVAVLTNLGYSALVEQRAGFEGARDPEGRVEPGWRPRGLPTSNQALPDRTYEALRVK
jgi:rhodanese-related sulfurtransferase